MNNDETFEQLLCGLLFLLSRHAHKPDPEMMPMIARHLHWLQAHPHASEFKMLRDTSRRLVQYWERRGNGIDAPAVPAPTTGRLH